MATGDTKFVEWTSLEEQFGSQYQESRKFVDNVKLAFEEVARLYTGAKYQLETNGIRLHDGSPSVLPKEN